MRKAPSKFVITCAPRTGSTMLRMMLNSHPRILCHGEVISLDVQPNLGRKQQKNINKTSGELATLRTEDPVNFLYEYVLKTDKENCEAVGVKIKYRQLEEHFKDIFRKISNDHSISIIHLTRKNLLKRYISHRLAGSKITPTVILDPAKKQEQPKIKINIQRCLEDISDTEESEVRFRSHFQNHKIFEVVYEDIIRSQNNVMNKLQKFLEIKPRNLKFKTIKVNSDNLEDIVENYQELATEIQKTSYAQYLEQ